MSKLQVLMLSYDDRVIAGNTEDTQARHLRYAAKIDHLHMIVWATTVSEKKPVKLSDHLTVYPVGHQGRPFYVLEAWQTAQRLRNQYPIDVITAQDPFFTALVGLWARSTETKLQIQNHSDFLDNPHWLAERPRWNPFLNRIAKYTLPKADRWRVVNAKEKQKYMQLGLPGGNIDVLPVGVDVKRFATKVSGTTVAQLRKKLHLSQTDDVLFWVGRPVGFKNVPLLIEAFAKVHATNTSAKLVLGGDFSSAADIKAQVDALGLSEVVLFAGAIPNTNLPAYFALADVYLHSSDYEGFGRVMVEAAASGTPIVATHTAGAREILKHQVTALLVPPRDKTAFATAILSLLDNVTLGQQLGSAAQKHVLGVFDPQKAEAAIVKSWQRTSRSK